MREVRRAAERFHTRGDGTSTWHSFSYGQHYDPDQIAFGPIIAINDESVAPSAGYGDHRHAETDIVTWVIEGTLRHQDSTGAGGDIEVGVLQHLRAGSGVTHAERNASDSVRLRFLQMMLRSDHDAEPQYAQAVGRLSVGPHEVVVVTGSGPALRPAGATLLHVTRGSARVGDLVLHEGDQLRTDEPLPADLVVDGEMIAWLLDVSGAGIA